MNTKLKPALLAASAVLAFPGLAHADETAPAPAQKAKSDPGIWRVSTGINVSEGDYGETQKTTVISAPLSLRYKRGGFSIRVSIPYVSIDGPGDLLDTPLGGDAGLDGGSGGSGGDDSGGDNSGSGSGSSGSGSSGGGDVITEPGAITDKRSGFGDVSVTLGYSLDFGTGTWLDTSARIKLPTASTASRLGTGKVDVTVGADLGQDIGPASIYVGGRRRFIGKDTGSTRRDVWALGTGISFRLPGRTLIGADYDWQQSTRPSEAPSSEVTGWINFGLSRKLRLQVFGSTGFTDNSADFAAGLSLSLRLN